MTDYIEILRLHSIGVSQRSISASVSCSRNTVSCVLKRAIEEQLQWPLPEGMNNQAIKKRLFPVQSTLDFYKNPDFDHIHAELARSGVTLSLLWHEYSESCRNSGLIPYKYSQFCKLYHDYTMKTKATMRIQHKPGEKLEVDWAGQTATIQNSITGKGIKAYVFVAVLPYSGFAYVEAFSSMNMESWIKAHVNCFTYMNGVAKILVPDNLKTGVQYASWFDSTINSTYNELAVYYNAVVIPARVRRPKDKPSVEGSVGLVSTWILAALRNQTFFSFSELNQAITEKLEELNSKPFQKKEGCRESVFLAEEKDLLIPLPACPYELAKWSKAIVQFNYHIYYDKMYYSVPFEYIKLEVDIRATEGLIEVFYKATRIASHMRLSGTPGQYQSLIEHMPERHQKYQNWNSERIILWAEKIGENTAVVVKCILGSAKVEQQGYRSCLALLKSADKYSSNRLEMACKRALGYNPNPGYKIVLSILKSGADTVTTVQNEQAGDKASEYGLTRGAEYYGREGK
jgi:transposase